MTRALIATVCALSLALASNASAQTEPAAATAQTQTPAYTVLESDVRIHFSNAVINGFSVGRDGSLIFQAGANHWYRATLWESCQHDLRWVNEAIGVDAHPNGTLDRFSSVIIRGRRCPIQTLDRIERPHASAHARADENPSVHD